MENEPILGESTLIELTIRGMRTPEERIKVIGQRYTSYIIKLKDEGKLDASRCLTYTCKYQRGRSKSPTFTLDNEFIVPLFDRLRTVTIPIIPVLIPPGKDG